MADFEVTTGGQHTTWTVTVKVQEAPHGTWATEEINRALKNLSQEVTDLIKDGHDVEMNVDQATSLFQHLHPKEPF